MKTVQKCWNNLSGYKESIDCSIRFWQAADRCVVSVCDSLFHPTGAAVFKCQRHCRVILYPHDDGGTLYYWWLAMWASVIACVTDVTKNSFLSCLSVRWPSAMGSHFLLFFWPTSAISGVTACVLSCPNWRTSPRNTGLWAGMKPLPRQDDTRVFSLLSLFPLLTEVYYSICNLPKTLMSERLYIWVTLQPTPAKEWLEKYSLK